MTRVRVLATAVAGAVLGTGIAVATDAMAGASGARSASGVAAGPSVGRVAALPGLRFADVPGTGSMSARAASLTSFTKSFVSGGRTYSYTMVGTDPAGAATTTTIPTTITPIKFVFSDGAWTSPTGAVNQTKGSPLFTSAAWPNGSGQYGDINLRASFWKLVGAKNWHVKLSTPAIKSLWTLSVPASYGRMIRTTGGVLVGLVNVNWLNGRLAGNAAGVPANVFPNYLSYQVIGCDNVFDTRTCGVGGFHSRTGNHTYSYATWLEPTLYGPTFADLAPMSHEISEWYHDPFVNNVVPRWTSPLSPQYGCTNVLETGDPLVGRVKTINGLHYQNEALLSFFTREKPSSGYLGRYDWFGNTFTNYSKSC